MQVPSNQSKFLFQKLRIRTISNRDPQISLHCVHARIGMQRMSNNIDETRDLESEYEKDEFERRIFGEND